MDRQVYFIFSNFETTWGDGENPPILDINSPIKRFNIDNSMSIDSDGFLLKDGSQILVKKNGVNYPVKLVKTKNQHILDSHYINPQNIFSNVVKENVSQIEFINQNYILGGSLTGNGTNRVLIFKFSDEIISSSYFVIEIFGYTDVLKKGNTISMYLDYIQCMSPNSTSVSGLYNEYSDGVFITNYAVIDSNNLTLSETDLGYSFVGQRHLHNRIVPQGRPFQQQELLSITKNSQNKYNLSLEDGYSFLNLGIFGQEYLQYGDYNIYTYMNQASNKISIETRISDRFIFSKIHPNANVVLQSDLDYIESCPIVYNKDSHFGSPDFLNGNKMLIPCLSVIIPNGHTITDSSFEMHPGYINNIKLDIKSKL